jgi:hypothetical protein
MTEPTRRITSINMSSIPVHGVGGLGMVAIAVVIAIEFPEAHWLLGVSLIGGAIIAAAMIAWRRRHETMGPSGDHPDVLFVRDQDAAVRRNTEHGSIEQLAVVH